MKTRTDTIYITEDGQEFATEAAAKEHELKVLGRLSRVQYFGVHHGPDTTEGRGLQSRTEIAVEADRHMAEHIARDWCQYHFGSHVAFAQGVAPMPNWFLISRPDSNSFNTKLYESAWGKQEIKKVFLSDIGPLAGFPEPSQLYWQRIPTGYTKYEAVK